MMVHHLQRKTKMKTVLLLLFLVTVNIPVIRGHPPSCGANTTSSDIIHHLPEGTQRNYTVGCNKPHIPLLEYLTKWVGSTLFDPPISFQYQHFSNYMDQPTVALSQAQGYDFMLSNPYRAACVESESNAVTLATLVKRVTVVTTTSNNGHNNNTTTTTTTEMPLTHFGAVLYVRNDNSNITKVAHVRDKVIGTNAIQGMATHMCQDLLLRHGLHHLQHPKQTIFYNHSRLALQAVLNGQVDVGCAASGTLEEEQATQKVRVLEAQQHNNNHDDPPYPLLVSTPLVSGFPFQAFPHVPAVVAMAVQHALLQMQSLTAAIDGDDGEDPSNNNHTTNFGNYCEQAKDAYQALKQAKLAGFTTPISNLIVRDIQEKTGYLIKPVPNYTGTTSINTLEYNSHQQEDTTAAANGRCVRYSSIVDAVSCPPGHFARTSQQIQTQCNHTGLDCYGNDCICKPCVQAYQVNVYTTTTSSTDDDNNNYHQQQDEDSTLEACPKFDVCGRVPQQGVLRIYARDNLQRRNATVTGFFLTSSDGDFTMDGQERKVPFHFSPTNTNNYQTDDSRPLYQYDYYANHTRIGQRIIRILLNGQEIPESPLRLWVTPRDCAADTSNVKMVPDEFGNCVCRRGMVEIGGASNCVALAILLPSILVPLVVLASIFVCLYIRLQRKQAEIIWIIQPDELEFDANPRVLGRGTFGVVLLAEFRGTPVAVKRVLPLNERTATSSSETTKRTGNHDPERRPHTNLKSMFETRNDADLSHVSTSTSMMQTKMIRKIGTRKRESRPTQADFMREMRLLSKLRHPCITTVMGAVKITQESMMVMEYMGFGSLYDLLHTDKLVLEERTLVNMLIEVASGLRFLHSAKPHQVVHGDMKSKNILVDEKFRAKVADFGLAPNKGYFGQYATGTPLWMAPELIRGVSANTPESDVYSFGIVLYEVFSRKDPYEGEHTEDLLRLISSKTISKRPPIPPNCPPEAASLMVNCWDGEPSSRPKSTELDIGLRMLGAQYDTTSASVGTRPLPSNQNNSHMAKLQESTETFGNSAHSCPPSTTTTLQQEIKDSSSGNAEESGQDPPTFLSVVPTDNKHAPRNLNDMAAPNIDFAGGRDHGALLEEHMSSAGLTQKHFWRRGDDDV